MTMTFRLALVLLMIAATGCSTTASDSADSSQDMDTTLGAASAQLKVATWNVEHLASPIDQGCRPRSEDELVALQEYARNLDADIVGLQEVASLDAVALLFPESDWQLFLSERPDSEPYTCRGGGQPSTQQKVAYAVRNGIEVIDVSALSELGLDSPGLRYGIELSVDTPAGAFSMLNVHMKSGCFVDNYSREDSDACQTLARQAPILDGWIESKEAANEPYMVMGDFNHRLSAPYNHLTQMLESNSDGSVSTLDIATEELIGCHPWYPAPIDHVMLGELSDPTLTVTPATHPFDDMDPDMMLSDHCAVSLTLQFAPLSLSNSVTWQTTSKEYAFLTTSTYERAAEIIRNADLPETPWVVTMDVDETVLDNSQYQVMIEEAGVSFSSATWAEWVASEEAVLVPGVDTFVSAVFESGGLIGFVTNRDREQDHHTWDNMQALGLPITLENACLLGRSERDRDSEDGQRFINDKDLRRSQLTDGSARCFQAEGQRHSDFPAATIVMQVGDNIEDFAGVTQESADVSALLAEGRDELILLPNPMYGSW